MKKRFIALLLAALMLLLFTAPALAAAPAVKETEYKGKGVIEVEFAAKKVTYRNVKVTVKDAAGESLKAKIQKKESDEIRFKVTGLKADSTYTYVISGVRIGKSGSYGTVEGSFKTPAETPEILKVKYDAKDRELDIDFATKVQYKALKVTVEDESGKALKIKKIKKSNDEIELRIAGMKKGQTYTLTVSGVRVKGSKGAYTTVTKTFKA